MKPFFLTVYLIVLSHMAFAQLTATGFNSVKLQELITAHPECTPFDKEDNRKFEADPASHFYKIPIGKEAADGINVRHAFAYADATGIVKKIILIIEGDDTVKKVERQLGPVQTLAETGFNNVLYSWELEGESIVILSPLPASLHKVRNSYWDLHITPKSGDLVEAYLNYRL